MSKNLLEENKSSGNCSTGLFGTLSFLGGGVTGFCTAQGITIHEKEAVENAILYGPAIAGTAINGIGGLFLGGAAGGLIGSSIEDKLGGTIGGCATGACGGSALLAGCTAFGLGIATAAGYGIGYLVGYLSK